MKVVILTVVLAAVISVDAKRSIRTQRNVCVGQPDGTFFADDTSCSNFFVCINEVAVSQSCGRGSYFDNTNLYCLPDRENICSQLDCTVNGALTPHPTNCSSFYVCFDGELVEQSCGAGSYFDSTNLYCLPDTDNICPQTQCSTEGAFSAHPTNCALFYVCYQGQLVEQKCDPGSYFDETNLYCIPDENNICPQAQCPQDGAFSPHPTECELFYVCSNGLLVEQTCGNGSYFDATNLYCLPDTDGICRPSTPTTEEPCTCVGGYTNGEFVASPDSCYSYYICSDGELVEQNCGYGNYFDNNTKRCERDTNGECWPISNTSTTSTTPGPCTCAGGYQEGEFVAIASNCSLYHVCTQGELVEQNCGYGNYFDNISKMCVRDQNGTCWTATTTTPAPCQCPGGYEEGDLVGNSDSCSSYFVCTQGELVAQSCGTGNYFDSNSKTCVRDDNAICWTTTTTTPAPCQCPGGYEEGDLLGNSDSCSSYFVCTQGELVAQSCGTGNYFDSNSKTCVRDDNAICWTTTTTTPAPCQCPGGYEEGYLVANSDSCSSYFVCTQGELVAQSCGTGNYFDSNSKTCVRDDNAICWTTTTTTSAPCQCPGGYEEGDLVGNSDSCSSYFVCTQGELVAQSCGTGNYFDSYSKTCVRDDNAICWATTTTTTTTPAPCQCPGGYEEGDLVGNSDSCSSYFVCTQGELVAQSCGTGNYFDSNSKTCVRDDNAICWTTTTTTPAPCQCPGGYEEGDLVGNSDSCSSYFVCTQGELVAQSCGTGNYFDSNSKTCVRDDNAICWTTTTTTTTTPAPCQCPGGYEEGDLVGNSDSCSSYFVCTQGELVAQSCGTGNYFDSNSKTCVRDDNGICWTTSSTPSTSTSTTTTTPSTSTPSTTKSSTTTTSTTQVPCTCPGGYEDGEFVPYPNSCYKFYICYKGELVEESCGYGNYFDAESKSCVWDSTGVCWPLSTSSSTPTTSASTTKTTPSTTTPSTTTPSSTTSSSTTASTTTASPSTPSTTTPSTTKTTPSTTTPSTTQAPCTCPGGYEDGEFVPYPNSCYKFYICYKGELIEDSCGYGNYFDAESKSCVLDSTGVCWPLSTSSSTPTTSTSTTKTTPSTTTPSTSTPSTTTSSSTTASTTTASTITPSTTTSSSTTASTTTASTTTPSTTTPSTTKTTPSTTTPSTTQAPCTCPGGYEDGEFVPYPNSCYKFYICYKGELIEDSCGYGNYFDAESKSCVLDSTGVCWPLSTSPSTPTTSTSTTKTTPSTTKPSTTTPSSTTSSSTTASTTTASTITPSTTTSSSTTASTTTASTTTPSTTTPSTTKTTPSTTTSSTTQAPCTCPGGYEDGEFVPYPNSCYKFYICYKGELVEDSCGYGNYFDAESKSCVLDSTGVCWPLSTSSSTPTTSTSTTKTTPSTTTPSTSTPSSTTSSSTTASTTTASTSTPSTTTPSTTKTTPSTTISSTTQAPCTCPGGYEDGEFVPYPNSCYMFYICYKGELIEESCGYGNYFDAESKSCVWDSTGVCWPLSTSSSTPTTSTSTTKTTPSTTTPSTSTPSTTTSSSTTASTTTASTITPSTTTSSSTTASTTTASTTTPSTTTPSTTKTTPSTTTPSTTQAPCTCPGGYEDGEFVPYPNSCYKFYICYKGELVEDSCGYGNYFDAESKSCVLDSTGVCWPLSTSSSTPSTSTSTTKTTPSTTTPSTSTPSSTTSSSTTVSTTTASSSTPSTTTSSSTTASTTTASTTTPSTTTSSTTKTTPSTTTPSTTQAPCTCPGGYEDGEFVPYPNSCYKFYICYKGELVEESCGYGNYFDADSKSCVLDSTGVCWPLSTSSSTPNTSTSTTKTTPSTTTPSTSTPSSTTSSSTTVSTTTASSSTPSTTTSSSTTASTTTASTTTPSTTTSSTTKTTPSTTTPSTTQAPCTCPGGYEDGEFVPYPNSCYKFYICYKGELVEESCGYGNYFDADSKSCVLDSTGVCWPLSTSSSTPSTSTSTTKTTPSTTTPSTSTPSTTTSSSTFVSTTTASSSTPATTTSSSTTASTTTASTTTPSTTTSSTTKSTPSTTISSTTQAPCTCPGGYNEGDFVPHPYSCYLFYVCYQGELVELSCEYGTYFDESTKSCVLDSTGVCWPKNTTSTTTTTTTTSPTTISTTTSPSTISTTTSAPATTPAPCTCEGGYAEGEFVPNPDSCYLFYVCYQAELVEVSCGFGNYFDEVTKSCVLDSANLCWKKTSSSSTTSTTSPPCTCPGGYENGDFIPHPDSCSSFYVCYQGELSEMSCGVGNYFDNTTKSCMLDTTGSCWSKPTSSSTTTSTTVSPSSCPNGYQDGQLISNPSSCYLYYICSEGKLVQGHCGTGNYFNNDTNVCEKDTGGCCWPLKPTLPPKPAPCECPNGLQEGQFVENPSSCYLYYICTEGELVEGNCGTGNYFNNDTKVCEPDTGGCCWPFKPTPPPKPAPCECPNGLQEGQFIENPSSCYLYYICSAGELVEGNCGTGNYFNNDTKVCEPDTGGCCWPNKPTPPPKPAPCECPNGLQEGQFMENPSSCYLYYICSAGELVEGNCGTGNFFNNDTKECEPDTGGCCWPNKPTPPPNPTPCECPNGLQEGQFIENPSSCYLYYICSAGELVEGNCGTGNYFNNDTKVCEPDTGGCCWPNKPTPPPKPAPCECPNGLQEGQFIENPSSCYLYYICSAGELVEGNCGTGNYFNNDTKECEPDTGGCCWPNKPTPPPNPTPCECSNGLQEGKFAEHPSSCYLYYICAAGELVESNCGTGNYFNNDTKECEPDTTGFCWPKNTNCPGGYTNGDFVPDPVECDKFFICYDGVLVPQDCGVGYFFDLDNKYCTRDINGSCWAAEVSNNTCEGVADGTFLPNEAACDKFFVCYNDTKIPQQCGVGNRFNSDSLTCIRDNSGLCWKKIQNVCAGEITGTFVQNPSNCQEFFVCHQNRAVLQQCNSDNWFNPQLMICQPDLKAECINVCRNTKGVTQLQHPNCNQFYLCVNGTTKSVATCPTGTNFDVTFGICRPSAICEASLCLKSTNGAVYPVQNDATSFYSCYNQIPVKRACPDGTSFNSALLICVPDTGMCIGKENGYAVASHNNPNAYYVCRNNYPIFEQCPSYAVFDDKKLICVHAQRKRLVKDDCATELDGAMLSGDSCNKYHLCLDGKVIEQNCGAYSSFSHKLGSCVFNLSCFDQNEICAKSSDIEKLPDARYETSFIKCKQGQAITEKCPENRIYSHDIGHCVPKEMAMTEHELDELCNNVPDNTMQPALDCRKFYICRNSSPFLQQCDIDQYFDIGTGHCLPDVERKCWMRSETLRRSFFLKTVCYEGQTRASVSPGDCVRFEICSYGVWTRESCPTGHFFDSKKKVCVSGDAEEMCPTSRSVLVPECLNDMPLRPSENLCTEYYRCEHNQWTPAKCPVGEFFNDKTAACTKDVSVCARNKEMQSKCISNETRISTENCGLYHICYDDEWWYRNCKEGAYFNKSLEACIPNDGSCRLFSNSSRCNNGTVKKSNFDPCVVYHLCNDGNWTVQNCPIGHHFNETRKACMLDDVDWVCQDNLRNESSSCAEGDRRYQFSNCKAFNVCSFGKWLSVECSIGFYFDTSQETCIPNGGECSDDGSLRRACTDNMSRPNLRNCTQFYYCSRNEWHLESCLEGHQYNATIEKCVQTNSTCVAKDLSNLIEGKCVGLPSGSYISHEDDCTKYYLCVDDGVVEAECNFGRFYNNQTKRCELNDGGCPLNTLTDNSICEGTLNGSHVQNPANCTTFYICTDTMIVLALCPPKQYFNAEIGACQTDTGECNKPRLCDDNPGGHLPHETYCNIYYACVRGIAIPVACDEDYIFDPSARKCTPDVEQRCVDGLLVEDEICAKAENGEPLVDSDDCTKYIVCSNGVAQTLQCPQRQFFNSDLMSCMPDDGSCPYVDGPDNPNNSSIPPDPVSCIGKHGDLMPDPVHCNEFYVCIYGNLRHDRCFDGEFFDTTTNTCIPLKADEKCPTSAEMTTLCTTSEDGTIFADPIDCRKYYQCNEAELQSKKCRTGESFDTLLGFCRQNDGTCLLENGQRVGACATKHGKLAADVENCRGYFTCINGQKISEECENTEYFDKVTSTCEKDVNNSCRPIEDDLANTTQLSCLGLTELVFYPNILDGCKTFFQCVKGLPRVHKCPDDLLFNSESGICDWKDYVKCIPMTEHQSNDVICVTANNGTSYGNTEDNCDSYFICTDGKLKSFKCDQGLKYNVLVEKCDLATKVNCTMTV